MSVPYFENYGGHLESLSIVKIVTNNLPNMPLSPHFYCDLGLIWGEEFYKLQTEDVISSSAETLCGFSYTLWHHITYIIHDGNQQGMICGHLLALPCTITHSPRPRARHLDLCLYNINGISHKCNHHGRNDKAFEKFLCGSIAGARTIFDSCFKKRNSLH